MPADEEGSQDCAADTLEKGADLLDPFAKETPKALEYVIDKWHLTDAPENAVIVIDGRITAMSATWSLKRGAYNSDAITGTIHLEPKNLPCTIVINKPKAEILAAGDDVGIVGAVYQRFAHELGLKTQQIMVEHMRQVYPEPPPATRVEAGERRDFTRGTDVF